RFLHNQFLQKIILLPDQSGKLRKKSKRPKERSIKPFRVNEKFIVGNMGNYYIDVTRGRDKYILKNIYHNVLTSGQYYIITI
ncbi:MAG: hypothetical protein LBI86_07135, partial [Treponema sp.]|nr:hypothetical protein [Treponema sp.]